MVVVKILLSRSIVEKGGSKNITIKVSNGHMSIKVSTKISFSRSVVKIFSRSEEKISFLRSVLKYHLEGQ